MGTARRKAIYFIIPVFNEAGNVPRLMDSLRTLDETLRTDFDPQFLIVDDGSADETRNLFEASRGAVDVKIISHPRNLGPGAAFATGFAHVAPSLADDDWVVTMEGDNTSRSELVEQMLMRSREGYEMILASPYMYGGTVQNTSLLRTFLSYCANMFMRELLELHGILTMSSFFRLYRGSLIRRMQQIYGPQIVERPGFDCMVEFLMKAVYLRVSLSEVPMVLDTSRRVGKSKMKIMRTIYNLLTLTFRKGKWKAAAHGVEGSVEFSGVQTRAL